MRVSTRSTATCSPGGAHEAFCFEGDRWDPSRNDGRGGPVVERSIPIATCCSRQCCAPRCCRTSGLKRGDRVAFNLPNIPEQLFYTEAAKRLGIIYTPVFGGFSAKTLSDRIFDAGAKVVVTADGGYRNAEVVPYKEAYTDPALDNFIPLRSALAALEDVLAELELGDLAGQFARGGGLRAGRRDHHRAQRRHARARHAAGRSHRPAARTHRRDPDHRGAAPRRRRPRRRSGRRGALHRPGDRRAAARPLVASIAGTGRRAGAGARPRGRLRRRRSEAMKALDDVSLWRALTASHPALPVPADWPLFVIYTSGSTGKPKGVVHTHGGWLSGIAHTMRTVFGVTRDDRIYVIADPGWITGQSYLVSAPLALGITSIVHEGSPLFPHAGRFSSIIERQRATMFKAGSTFLKAVMTDPASTDDMAAFDMTTLKAATFCAEPVSPAVQQFAMDRVCDHYVNSYWATEHGGIVFSCPWGGFKPLAADARTWSLPWIDAEVRIAEASDDDGPRRPVAGGRPRRKGRTGHQAPYPYLARTIWGDAERLGTPEWRGDLERFRAVYFDRWDGGSPIPRATTRGPTRTARSPCTGAPTT